MEVPAASVAAIARARTALAVRVAALPRASSGSELSYR